MDFSDVFPRFEKKKQDHVFKFWSELNKEERAALLADCATIDLDELEELIHDFIINQKKAEIDFSTIEPIDYVKYPTDLENDEAWLNAYKIGAQAIAQGKVAAFTPAGGQGSRLGFDSPKGLFPISPVAKKSLFQVFGEKILAASILYGSPIPWYIMTSVEGYDETVAHFVDHDYFGLDKDNVMFFIQNRMPAVDFGGKILLKNKHSIALTPDGHGGSFKALYSSGSTADMKKRGVEMVSFFQVDNPLANCIDPYFVGFHALAKSEFSSKACIKQYPSEKVGVLVKQGEQVKTIEYSDLPAHLAEERLEDGTLKYGCGSIGMHLIELELIEKAGGSGTKEYKLPFHLAKKKINCVAENGKPLQPTSPNGYKFEMFGFDALDFAKNSLVLETKREIEFSPVKNSEGKDSPKTAKEGQLIKFSKWLEKAGVSVPKDDHGVPQIAFEISPLYALTESEFVRKFDGASISDGEILE